MTSGFYTYLHKSVYKKPVKCYNSETYWHSTHNKYTRNAGSRLGVVVDTYNPSTWEAR